MDEGPSKKKERGGWRTVRAGWRVGWSPTLHSTLHPALKVLHPPLPPALKVLHPTLHPTLRPVKLIRITERENCWKWSKRREGQPFYICQNPKTTFLHGSLLNVRVALSWLSTQLIKQKTVYKFYHSTRLFIKRPCSSDKLSTLLFKQTSVYNSFLSSRFFN